jgi:hypothetical protein
MFCMEPYRALFQGNGGASDLSLIAVAGSQPLGVLAAATVDSFAEARLSHVLPRA